jgi:hypothetical protein
MFTCATPDGSRTAVHKNDVARDEVTQDLDTVADHLLGLGVSEFRGDLL